MEISIEDFNALSAEQSRRDVKIARLEMELRQREEQYAKEVELLRGENMWLSEQLALLRANFENMRFENHWMKQYILLSVERVQDFCSHIRDFALLSAIKTFVLDMLPANATAEQIAYTRNIMQTSPAAEEPRVVKVQGNYNDFHDNGSISFTDK